MAFDGSDEQSSPEQVAPVAPYELPPLIPPASREPSWLIAIGVACFLGFLALTWWSHRLSADENSVAFLTSVSARTGTYFVEMLLYYQQGEAPTPFASAQPSVEQLARQAAHDWQVISEASTDPEHQGLTALNAAALYHVAGGGVSARAMLERAERRDRPHAPVYRALRPLYSEPASPVRMTREMRALLDRISAGPLVLARSAELSGKSEEIAAALRPGVRAAQRLMLFTIVVALVFFGLLIVMLLALALAGPRTWRAAREMHDTPGADVPWGIGTGLIVVSLSYFTVALLQGILQAIFSVKDNPDARMLIVLVATLLGPVIIVGVFLLTLDRKPWEWGVLGWTPSRQGIWYGALTVLAALPIILGVSWFSSQLFNTDQGASPLISELVSTDSVLLKLMIALTAVVVAPLVEETLFRGILFRAMNARLPFWTAAIASGFIFATAHDLPAALLPITLLGVLFAFLTRRSQSLLASAGAHAVYNGVITVIMLLLSWAMRGPGSS